MRREEHTTSRNSRTRQMPQIVLSLLLLLACAVLPTVAGALLDRSFASIPILPSDDAIAEAASAPLSAPSAYTSLSASNSFGSGAPYLSSAVLALETGAAGAGGLEIDDAALLVSSWQSGASRIVTGWTDTSGRGNHLRAASLATAPQARPFPALSGLPAIMFRGSSLIREMSLLIASDLSTSSSIQGLPLGASERTLSMVVRFVSASGHDQCGIQSDDTRATAGKEFINAPGGFSYGSISASGVKSSFGVGSNLRNEFTTSASGFSLSSLTEVSGDKDLSNTTIPTDSWGVLTTVVRADPLGVAGTVEAKVYWNTDLVAVGKIAQVDTQLPVSSEAPVGGVFAASYAGNSLDEPAASFDPLSKLSWTSPYGIGALVGLSTSSSASNISSFTPGFIALGGSQNFSSCMDVAAVVVYDVALSVVQQAELDNYLGAKWLSRQAPFNALPSASNPTLPLPSSIVLNLQADVGLVLSSAASLKSWRDQSASGNDLYVAFANYSAAALWSYPTSPYAPAAVGGSDNPNQMLMRPAPGSQSIRSVFGVGPAGGGVLIRRNALNGHPVLHMRTGQHVQKLQQRMVGYTAGTAVTSTVSLASPSSAFTATPVTPMHGGMLRGAPSPGQELRDFPTAVADRTLVTVLRLLPGVISTASSTDPRCVIGILYGRNSRSDNDHTAVNTTAKGIFTDGLAQGMGMAFTPSLVPASTLLSPTVADFPATFPASTSPTDFFIHTLMWKAGVESSYLNGTLIGSRVLPAASAFAAIPSSDTSFAINSGLPVANLALAKRLNPSASYSDFNSSLDLNTGCGGDIEVAAVLLYNRALMDPERDIVTGYLASKYFGASSGFGNTDASYPERIGGGNALQTRIQAVNGSIVSRVVPTRLELVGEGFGRSASDLTGAGVTFGPVSGQEYVCDSALWSNSTALICTLSPSVLKSSDLSLSMKFVGWINWKPSVASVSLLTFAPATVANSFQVTGTTAATKLPEGSFLKLEVRTMLSLTAAVNLAVSVSSSGSGAAAPRLPTVVSPASGIVEFPLRAAWSPASIAEISVYAGWCTVSGGSGASCVLTVSFAISGPNPQSLVAPSDVVVTVSGAPFSTAVISAIYATAGDKYGCENGVTARDLDVTLADTARRMHFCSSLRVAALSASWIEFDIWPQLSGLAKTAMLSLTPSAVLGGAGALSLTVSWTKTFDSVASSFAVKPAPYSATTQTISVNAVLTAQSFDIATVINDALGSAQAQSSSPPLRVTIQLAYNSGSDLQFDVDAVKMDIVWMCSLSVGTFPQVLFPNQLSPPLTLTFNGRFPADAEVSVSPSWGWMGSSLAASFINLIPASSNSIVQRQGDTVSFQTFSSGLGVQTPASMDFSVSVTDALLGLPVSDVSSVSMPSVQLAPSALSFASVNQLTPGILGSRQGFGLVVDPVSDKIFVIGGYNRDTTALINSVYMSLDAASWTLMAAPSFTPRESFCSLVFPPAAGAANSIIVIMGGLGGSGPLQDAHRTTDGGLSWSAQSAPGWSPARSRMGCTLHSDGFAYMIAGESSGGPLNDVWRSADGVTWSQVSIVLGFGFVARSGAALISFQGNLLLMPCKGSSCTTMDISVDGTSWRQLTSGGEIYAVTHGQRALTFTQASSNNIHSSADGEHWNSIGTVAIDYLTRPSIAVFQGRLLIVGTAAGKQTAAWIANAQASAIGSPFFGSVALSHRVFAASATDPITGVSVVAGGNLAADLLDTYLSDCWCTLDGVNWHHSTSSAPWTARAAAHLGFLTRTGLPSVLILSGGISATPPVPDVWMSDDLLGSSWTQLADAPVQRYFAATVQHRGALLIISGVEYYNMAATDVWKASWPDGATDVLWEQLCATMDCDPTPFSSRVGAAAVVSNDKIILTGGYAVDELSYLNDVWISDDGALWTEVIASAPWTARNQHGIVHLPNNVLLLFGGTEDGSGQLQDCWASADGALRWRRSMQCGVPALAGFNTLSLAGIPAMVVAGVSGTSALDVYTIQSMTSWSCLFGTALPVDRTEVSALASPLAGARAQANLLFDSSSDTLLLLNGYTGAAATTNIYRSTNRGVSWSLLTPSAALPARYSAGAAVVRASGGSVAVVCGGLDSIGTAQADCWSSSTADGQLLAASWSQVNAAASFGVRSGHSLMAVGDNTLVIVGGRGAGGVPSDDVWSSADLGVSWSRVCVSPFSTRDRHGAASQWTLMAQPNPQQQNRGAMMPVMMVAGGVSSVSSSYLNDVYLSLNGGTSWQQLLTAPWLARQGHQLLAAAGVWYVVGGQADPAVFGTLTLQDAWLTVDGIKWTSLTAATTHMGQRVDFAAVAFASDGSVSPTLLVVGGRAAVSPASLVFDDAWSAGPLLDPSVLVSSYSFSRVPDAHATLFKEWSGAELTDGQLVQGIAAVDDGSVGWLSSVRITFRFASTVVLSALELGYSVQSGVSVAPVLSGIEVSMDGGLSFFSVPLNPITPAQQMPALRWHNSLLVSLASASRPRAMQVRVHLRPPTGSLLPFVLDEVTFFGVPVGPLPRSFVPPAPNAVAPSGWFDAIGQGAPNDYCVLLSALDPAPQWCQLAGPLGVSQSNQLLHAAGVVTPNLCSDVQCDPTFSCQSSTGLCSGGRAAFEVTAIPSYRYTCGSTLSFITVTPPQSPTSSVTVTLLASSPNDDLIASPSSLTFVNADPQSFNLSYPACSTVASNATADLFLSFALTGPSATEFIAPSTRTFSSLHPSAAIYFSGAPAWLDSSADRVLSLQVVLATSFYLLHPDAIVSLTSSAGVIEPALLIFTADDEARRMTARSITFTLSSASAASLTSVTISARVGGSALVLSSQFELFASVRIALQSAEWSVPSLASTVITAGFVSAPVVVLPPLSLRSFPAFVTISVADGFTPALLTDAMPVGRLLPATSLRVRVDRSAGASFRLLPPASATAITLLFAVEGAEQFSQGVRSGASITVLSPCAASGIPANGVAGTCARPTAVNATCSIACNSGFRISGAPLRCGAGSTILIGTQSCVSDASVTTVPPLELSVALSSLSNTADPLGVSQAAHSAANLSFAHPTTVSVLLQPTGWFVLQAIDVSYSAAMATERVLVAGVEVSVDHISFYSLPLPANIEQLFAAVGSHTVRVPLPSTPIRSLRVCLNLAAALNPSFTVSQIIPLGYPFVPAATPTPPVSLSGAASVCPSLLPAPGWFDAQMTGSAVDFCYLIGSSCADAYVSCQLATSAYAQTPRGQFRYDSLRSQLYQDPCFYQNDSCSAPALERAVYLSPIPVQPYVSSISYGLTMQVTQQTAPLSVSLLFTPSGCARVVGGDSFWLTDRVPQSFNLSNPSTVAPCTISVAAVGLSAADLPPAVVILAIQPASVLASGISNFVNANALSSLSFTLSVPPRLPPLTLTLSLSAGGGTLSASTHSWTTLTDTSAFLVDYTAPASSATPITLSLRLTSYAAGGSSVLPWLDPADPAASSAISPAGGYAFTTSYSWQLSPPCTAAPTAAFATMDAGCPASVPSGSSCPFTCDSGTAIQGLASVTCMGGSWVADGTCMATFLLPTSLSMYRFESASMVVSAGRVPASNVTLTVTSSAPASLLLQSSATLLFSAALTSATVNFTSALSGQYTLSFAVGGADAASYLQPAVIIVRVLDQATFVFGSLPTTIYTQQTHTLIISLSEPANYSGVALVSEMPFSGAVSTLSYQPRDASMVTAGLPLSIVAPWTLSPTLVSVNLTVSGSDRAHYAVPQALLINIVPCLNITASMVPYFYVAQSSMLFLSLTEMLITTVNVDFFSATITSSGSFAWSGGFVSSTMLPVFSAVDVLTVRFRSSDARLCPLSNLTIPVLPRANITILGLRADRRYYQNQFVDGLTIVVSEAPLIVAPILIPTLMDNVNSFTGAPVLSMPVGQTTLAYSFTVPKQPRSNAALIASFIATGVYTLKIRFSIPPNGESPHYAVPADIFFTILARSYLNITALPLSMYSLQQAQNISMSVKQPVNVGTNLTVTFVVSPADAVVISPAVLLFTPGESVLNFTITASMLTSPALVSISMQLGGTDAPHYLTPTPRVLTVLPTSALMAANPPIMQVSPSTSVSSCDPFSIDIASSVAVQYGLARSYVWSLISVTHAQGPLIGQLDSTAEGALLESVLNSSSIDSGVGLGYTFGTFSAGHTLLSFPAHLLTMNRIYTFGVLIGGLPNTSVPTWSADTLFWSSASLAAIHILPPTMPTITLTGPATLRRDQDALYTVALTTTCSPNIFANVSFVVSDQLAPEIPLYSPVTSPLRTLSIAKQGSLLLAGQNYTIAATVTFFDNLGNILDVAATALNTTITRMPLVASILGGNQIRTIGVNLTLDASASHDPDTIGLASPPPLVFSWTCFSQNATVGLTFATLPTSGYLTPCSLAMLSSSTTPVLEVPDSMTAGDTVYQFTLSIVDNGSGRTASEVQLVWVRFAAPYPDPVIVLSSPTAQTRVNPQDSIIIQSTVTLPPNVTTNPSALIYAWSVTILPLGATPALSPPALALPLGSVARGWLARNGLFGLNQAQYLGHADSDFGYFVSDAVLAELEGNLTAFADWHTMVQDPAEAAFTALGGNLLLANPELRMGSPVATAVNSEPKDLALRPGLLLPGYSYRFTCHVTDPGAAGIGGESEDTFDMHVNAPPSGGSCSAVVDHAETASNAALAVQGLSAINVTCSGWTDEDTAMPLTYAMSSTYEHPNGTLAPATALLSAGLSATRTGLVLAQNRTYFVISTVRDSEGARHSVMTELNVPFWAPLVIPPIVSNVSNTTNSTVVINPIANVTSNSSSDAFRSPSLCELTNITQMMLLPSLYQQNYGQSLSLLMLLSTLLSQINTTAPATDLTVMCQGPPVTNTIIGGLGQIVNSTFASNTQSITLILQTINNLNFTSVDLTALETLMRQILGRLYGSTLNGTNASGPGIPMSPQENTDILQSLADVLSHYFGAGDCASFNSSLAITLQLADALLLGSTPLPDARSVMLITESFLVGTQRARMVTGIRTELAWRPWDQNRTVSAEVKAGFGMLDVSLSSTAMNGLLVAKQIANLNLTPDPKVDVVMLQFHSDWNRCRPGGLPLGSASHLILRDADTHLPLDFTAMNERVYFKQRARVEIVPSSVPTTTLASDGVTFLQEIIPAFPTANLAYCNFSYMSASGQINPSTDAGRVLSVAEMAFNADRCPVSCSFVNEAIGQYAGAGCSVASVLPAVDGVSTHLEVTCACNHLTEFSLLYDRDISNSIVLGEDPWFETSAVYLVFLCLYIVVAVCTLYELVRIVKNAACEQWVLLGAHIVLLLVAGKRIVGQCYFLWSMQHTAPSLSFIGALMIAPQAMANVLWYLMLYLWASIRIHRVITPATVATSAAAAVSLVSNTSNAIASPSTASSSSSTAPPSPVALLVKDVDPFLPLRSLFGGLNCVGALAAVVLFAKLGVDSTEDARQLDLVLAAVVMLFISAASVLTLMVYASWLIRSLPKPIPPARLFSAWTYSQKHWGHFLCALWTAMFALVLYSFLHVDTYLSKMHRLHAGYLSMDILQLLVCLRLLKVLVNPLYAEAVERRAKRHLSTRKQVPPPPQQKPDWRLGSTQDLLAQAGSSSRKLATNTDAANAFAALQRQGSQFTVHGLVSPSAGSPAAASGVARVVPSCESILIVGADHALADRLLEAGFKIADVARDGATALDMAAVKRYDAVVVLDAADLGMQATFLAQSLREIEQSKGRTPCHALAVTGLIDSLAQQTMEAATLNGCIESGQYLPDAVLEALKKLNHDPSKFVVIAKQHSAEPSRTSKDDTKSHWKFIKMAQPKQAEREAGKAAAAFEAAADKDGAAAAGSAEGVVAPDASKTTEGETEEDEQARLQNHRWLLSAFFNDTQAPAQGFRHQRAGQAVGAASAHTAAVARALPGDAPAYRPPVPAPTVAASRRSAPPSGSNTPGAVVDTPDDDIDSDVQWNPNPIYRNPADEVGDELTGGGASGYATPRAGARSASACNTPGSKSISTNDVVMLKSGSATPVMPARAHIRSPSGVAPEASSALASPSASPPKPQPRRAAGAPPASQKNLFSNSPFSEQFVPAKNAPGSVARRSSSDKRVKQPAAATNKAVTAGNTPSGAAAKPQRSVPASIASRPLDLAAMSPERDAGPVSGRGSGRLGPASPAKRVLDFTVEQVPSARSIHFNPNPEPAADGGLGTNRDVQDDPELLRALRMEVPAQRALRQDVPAPGRVDDGNYAAPAELVDSATGLPLDLPAAAVQASRPASAASLAPSSMRVTEVQPTGAAASSSSSAIMVAAKAPQPQSALFGAFTPSPAPVPFVPSSSSVFAPNAEVTGVASFASFAPPPARIVTTGMVVAPNPPPGIASKIQTPRHHPSPSMPLTTFTLPPSALRSSPPAVSPAVSPPLRAWPSNSRANVSIPSGASGDSISYQNRLNGMSLDDSGNLHAGLAALASPDGLSDLSLMPSSGVLNRAGLIKAPSRGSIGLVDPQLIVPTRPKADSPVITRPRPLRTTSSGGDGLLNRGALDSPSSATLAAASVRTPMGAGVGSGAGAAVSSTFASSAVSRSSPRPRMSPPPGIIKPAAGAK